jgi:alkylation response protein AidB-like acyl-CoA dehydrogenase
MTFDLSPTEEAARARARVFAHDRVSAAASAIDEHAVIPADLLREGEGALVDLDDGALVVAVEEIATVSAATAAALALGETQSSGADLRPGLRGFSAPATDEPRARLVGAAVALGIGRAALENALAVLRESAPGAQQQEKPHWVVADAATEVEAARLLTRSAAQNLRGREGGALVAIAKLAATKAAQQAVEAALRVGGPESFARGSLLERLTRDVRAIALLLGTEEELRATAADALYTA